MHPEFHRHLLSLLAGHGIHDTHGVELFRTIRTLSNAYEMIAASCMRQENLSGPRWRLLLHLYMAEQTGQASLSPSELSRAQNVTRNTISSLLRTLEEQGLIERALHPEDRRQFQICLSQAGRDLIHSSTPRHVAYLNHLACGLSREETDLLRQLLHKLHASLVKCGDLPDAHL